MLLSIDGMFEAGVWLDERGTREVQREEVENKTWDDV